MHVKPIPRIEPIEVQFEGRTYEITFDGSGAHVPENLGRFMLAQGLVTAGFEPNPKPRFERLPGGVVSSGAHGEPMPMFAPWVREV